MRETPRHAMLSSSASSDELSKTRAQITAGSLCWYRDQDGSAKKVEVVSVDRSIIPPEYWVIVDGRKRQTEGIRLTLIRPNPQQHPSPQPPLPQKPQQTGMHGMFQQLPMQASQHDLKSPDGTQNPEQNSHGTNQPLQQQCQQDGKFVLGYSQDAQWHQQQIPHSQQSAQPAMQPQHQHPQHHQHLQGSSWQPNLSSQQSFQQQPSPRHDPQPAPQEGTYSGEHVQKAPGTGQQVPQDLMRPPQVESQGQGVLLFSGGAGRAGQQSFQHPGIPGGDVQHQHQQHPPLQPNNLAPSWPRHGVNPHGSMPMSSAPLPPPMSSAPLPPHQQQPPMTGQQTSQQVLGRQFLSNAPLPGNMGTPAPPQMFQNWPSFQNGGMSTASPQGVQQPPMQAPQASQAFPYEQRFAYPGTGIHQSASQHGQTGMLPTCSTAAMGMQTGAGPPNAMGGLQASARGGMHGVESTAMCGQVGLQPQGSSHVDQNPCMFHGAVQQAAQPLVSSDHRALQPQRVQVPSQMNLQQGSIPGSGETVVREMQAPGGVESLHQQQHGSVGMSPAAPPSQAPGVMPVSSGLPGIPAAMPPVARGQEMPTMPMLPPGAPPMMMMMAVAVAAAAAKAKAGMSGVSPMSHVHNMPRPTGVPPISGLPGAPPPISGLPGAPPMPGTPPGGLPSAKRAKVDVPLVTEAVWTKLHPEPIDVKVMVPDDTAHHRHSFYGQCVTLVDRAPSTTVLQLKDELVKHLADLGANKIKMTHAKHGVLKDSLSIAHYNFLMGENVTIAIKERGGASGKAKSGGASEGAEA